MRQTKLFQVRDKIAQTVTGPIITARHIAAATRIFTDALKDNRTMLGQHPDDFELVELGLQDEETGELTAYTEPKIILTGKQWAIALQEESLLPEREQKRSDTRD